MKKDLMALDNHRLKVRQIIHQKGWTLKDLSMSIGKNHGYLHQYFVKGLPHFLPRDVIARLASHLNIEPEILFEPGRSTTDEGLSSTVRCALATNIVPFERFLVMLLDDGHPKRLSDIIAMNVEAQIQIPRLLSVAEPYVVKTVEEFPGIPCGCMMIASRTGEPVLNGFAIARMKVNHHGQICGRDHVGSDCVDVFSVFVNREGDVPYMVQQSDLLSRSPDVSVDRVAAIFI